ncbi:MAG: hypothetical protein ABIK32_05835 [Chloroflexota bacterium]|nr:hypothetical protein [Chloroflexota bacterium]
MEHLVRAGLVVLIVLAVIVVVPRVVPAPAIFEEYGFYPKSSDENTEEWASLPVKYVDNVSCSSCHQENFSSLKEAEHSGVSCETCHGPGKDHIDTGIGMEIDNSREFCGLCHDSVVARPSEFPQVNLDEHGGQSNCVTCHNPHSPLEALTSDVSSDKRVAVSIPAVPHTLEGREECLLCHDTGGLKPYPLDHEGREQESCLSCHESNK